MAGFAVVDCETTGLRATQERIIEVGVVLLDSSGAFQDEWSTLVNPLRPVTSQFIHGIYDDDVASAPTFTQILPGLTSLLETRAVVAHNAVFDVAFLNAEFERSSYPMTIPAQATVCTMELSKIYLPEGRHSLVSATERAGISLGGHHRALVDARGAADLLRHYMLAESRGIRYAQQARSREGSVTKPAAWLPALQQASALDWPVSLF